MKASMVDKINVGLLIMSMVPLLTAHNIAGFFFCISALMQTIRIIHMQSQQGE